MAERSNLFMCFVLAVIAIPSIVTSFIEGNGAISEVYVPRNWLPDGNVTLRLCNSVGKIHGLECAPFCTNPVLLECTLACLCEDSKLLCELYSDTETGDIYSESCRCRNPGWKGVKCTEPCDNNYYGLYCMHKCECQHNASCDRFSGGCTCTAGYQGPICEDKCPTGSYGFQCSNVCKCQNGAMCHHVDGSCECTAGWMGEVCAEPCLEGTYGINCSETCDCFRNAPCNVTTGDCKERTSANKNNNCFPGFSGKNCENRDGWKGVNCAEPCDNGFYGSNCKYECQCENNAICDRFTGKCTCAAGYKGTKCKWKCRKGTYGYGCSSECKCQNGGSCHHVDGSCECTAGWTGPECAEPCPSGTYGINCSKTCDCFKNASCEATTGDCIYTEDMFECHCDANSPSEAKNLNDDQEISSILKSNNQCLPGFSGTNCENRACPDNKWGETCSNECNCKNRSYCHPVTGSCWCEFGWTGEDCSVAMMEGSGMTYEVRMYDTPPL